MKIPVHIDDIAEEYMKLPEDKRSAVTNLMQSEAYLSVCCHDKKGKDISLDWKADQGMSIHLIMGIILTGRSEFGKLWLNELLSKISLMT